jgi:hypothetical protein
MLRSLLLTTLAVACAKEEPPPICADVCDDGLVVEFGGGLELSLYNVDGTADGVAFAFECDDEDAEVTEGDLDIDCFATGFEFREYAPRQVEVSLNGGVYTGSLTPQYSSAHPSVDCSDLCQQAVAVWDLGI